MQNLSSEQRPITMRRRVDLDVSQSLYQGEPSWIIKDPVGLKYFRLLAPEFAAFEMLDGVSSYQDLKLHLDQLFPDFDFRLEDVHGLVNSFHQNGLLLSSSPGQSQPLIKRRNKELKQKATQLLMSAMSLKFPGVDPDRFLSWLYPKVRWLFSPIFTALMLALCGSASILVLQNLDEFFRRLPEFNQFFDLKNVAFLGVILIVTKTIHELGHGLMCKHFGGECHEIGFMLLVMMPVMYCNTSDSWVLKNKWHRIAIGAAGMWVEIVMAAVCTFVWWYTQPSAIHYMALNVIFLCSVSTLLFNANPLLRYDGYYMLADYLEIPNLAQKSKTALMSKLRVACLGMKPIESRLQPTRHAFAFASYSVASFVYRWFVILMIFWFVTQFFEPYGLEIIGHLMIAMSVVGMVVIPLFKLAKFFLYPGRVREVKTPRLIATTLGLTAVVVALFLIPVPHTVRGAFLAQPVDVQKVFVKQAGVLETVHVRPGDAVNQGEVLAELSNDDVKVALERLKGELASRKSELSAYRLNASTLVDGSRMISETKVRIADIQKRIRLVEEELDSLKMTAQRSGVVIQGPNVPASVQQQSERRLVGWSGSPLEQENRFAFLERGTLFCLIGNPNEMKAMLVIDQSVAKFVAPDQHVELMFDELPGQRLIGVVESVSREPLQIIPRELVLDNGGSVAGKPMAGGQAVPLIPAYEATVRFENPDGYEILTGFRGQAKIRVGELPLGQRFVRYLHSVINFR